MAKMVDIHKAVPAFILGESDIRQAEVVDVFHWIITLLSFVTLSVGNPLAATASGSTDEQAIVKWEHDAVEADLAGDAEFYARNLSERWTDGMSDGTFQTKRMLLDDLRDAKRNITTEESLAHIRVIVAGVVAVATYRETYDALIHTKRVRKTIITTDTFVKQSGRWIQIAAHSSAVRSTGRVRTLKRGRR